MRSGAPAADAPTTTARQELREATAADHRRVDDAFAAFGLTQREGYVRFLQAHAHALFAVEQAIEDAGAAAIVEDWAQRRRAHLLRGDLEALGVATDAPRTFELSGSPAAVLGAVYVLEGSRLGGAVLARSVAPSLPRAYLGASDPARWRALTRQIDHTLVSVEDRRIAIEAARRVFARFEEGARVHAHALQGEDPVS